MALLKRFANNWSRFFCRSYMNSSGCTIYSLSSGHIKCGVSVIRVSGPQAKHALRALVNNEEYEPKQRLAYLKSFYHPSTKEMIDKGLLLWFPGPASFTGEDSCEFQVHGSLAVIAAMLDALGQLPGLRPAHPGEFTKRAFFGGKLDLTEVEGLADLIHAETEAQRKQALLQSTGSLKRLYDSWRMRMIRCAAHLEAYIDFAEEEQIEAGVIVQLTRELKSVKREIHEHLNDQRQGELLRDGVRTVIIGAPNVGKSSLLNLLCQRSVSIVTEQAGTTRDIIEAMHNFGGYPVIFSDTAGLRKHTKDTIELEGMARAKKCLEQADLILLLTDAKALQQVQNDADVDSYIKSYLEELDLPVQMCNGKRLHLIANKSDTLSREELERLSKINAMLTISCQKQDNIPAFLSALESILQKLCGTPRAEHPRITHMRYRQQLVRCIEHIEIFLREYSPDVYPDMAIAAQKLRLAVRCIERITGHVHVEDILDVVFKDFCIGK
ncbi:tRNA modification GTPase GTPBP3, mitochondrial [Scaptodrosophila lebanonensis]|uniref:tRNA modification GTPase GTPBP3, mitochondrial n=1 Tax=Drosophila lebanonensis TaxID=7225 RepID=A0A6J2TNN8_DROLE|nr:tRNA modification GTPase GTPBP3, mitochondrial [Scaptodrosophila lebanonensis]